MPTAIRDCTHVPKCMKFESHAYNEAGMSKVWAKMPPVDSSRNEIRLVTLHPGQGFDEIRCTVTAHALSANPDYEALSYTWGREKKGPPIESQISIDDTLVDILPNLFLALHRLRDPTNPRVLWTDYICIDQSSEMEKMAQVALMRQIYQCGRRTIVFLGEAVEDDNKAMLLISAILRLREAGEGHLDQIDKESLQQRANALRNFIKRVWFTRVWTVQEVVLAKATVLYSSRHEIPWENVTRAGSHLQKHRDCCVTFLQDHQSLNGCVIYATNIKLRDPKDSWDHTPWTRLLSIFHNHKASDPRDRIYALQPLLDPNRADLIPPDYNLCLPLVLRRVAIAMLRESPFNFLMQFAGSLQHPERLAQPLLPSWAADFAHQKPNFFQPKSAEMFSASGSHTNAKFEYLDEDVVSFSGLLIDSTTRISTTAVADFLERPEEAKAVLKRIDVDWKLYREIASGFGPEDLSTKLKGVGPPEDQASLRSFYTTLAGGVLGLARHEIHRRITLDDDATFEEARTALEAYSHRKKRNFGALHEELVKTDDARGYIDSLYQCQSYSRCFTTEHGRFGIGPQNIETGDKLVIFEGGRCPFLLRATNRQNTNKDDAPLYQLLGPAYVHGIMDGEAVVAVEDVNDSEASQRRKSNATADTSRWAPIYLA